MKEDILNKYNTKLFNINSSVFNLKRVGFDLSKSENDISSIASTVDGKIFQLESLDFESKEKEDVISKIYVDALKELDIIELKEKYYYKIYELTENIIEKLKRLDKYSIDELINDVLSLLEAIREGKIIISDKDRYLIEKVFKTIYEVLKIAYVVGKEDIVFDAINNNKEIVSYINEFIKEDIDSIKNEELSNDIKLVKKGKGLSDNLFDKDMIAALVIIKSDKYNEEDKSKKVEEIIEKIDTPELNLVEELQEKNKVKKFDNNKENPFTSFGIGAALITEGIVAESKFDKEKSEELVIGKEEIIVEPREEYFGSTNDYSEYGKYENEYDTYEDLNEKMDDNDRFYYLDDDKTKGIDFDRLPPKISRELKNSKDLNKTMLNFIPALLGSALFVGQTAALCALIGAKSASRIIGFANKQIANGMSHTKVLGTLPIVGMNKKF